LFIRFSCYKILRMDRRVVSTKSRYTCMPLERFPGYRPWSINRSILTILNSHSPQTTELESMLATLAKFPYPWKLKFQIRKLATNGFLNPSQILAIKPRIVRVLRRSDLATCIVSVQMFRSQILYAGAKIDAEDLEL